jgi:segregation and condensation protein B
MRPRPTVPAVQLGSAALRYQDLMRPPRDRPRAVASHDTVSPGVATAYSGSSSSSASRRDSIDLTSHVRPGLARDDRMAQLEAVLFVAKSPLHTGKLGQYANLADGTEARTLILRLNLMYDQAGSAFRVVEVAGGWQLRTRRQFANWLRRLPHVPKQIRLSAPAMETLAVIAYRQPVVRADVESIRGVACGEIIRQLMDRELVRVAGRSEELGRPFLYSTTIHFLEIFGLHGLDELPRAQWIQQPMTSGLPPGVNVQDENEAGESVVTLTGIQQSVHKQSVHRESVEQPLAEPTAESVVIEDEPPISMPVAQDDKDEKDGDSWDDDEEDEWDEGDDDEEEFEDVDDEEEADDEWEEVEVEVEEEVEEKDDEEDEWEDVEEGEDVDDDEYEYEEVEVEVEEDDDDQEYEDDEYEYVEVEADEDDDELDDESDEGDDDGEWEDGEEEGDENG